MSLNAVGVFFAVFPAIFFYRNYNGRFRCSHSFDYPEDCDLRRPEKPI